MSHFRLGQMQEALDDFDALNKKDTVAVDALRYRTIVLARLGKKPDALAGLDKLTDLRLSKTKVTKVGVEKFAKTRPACRIEWDCGTIEPKN